MVATSSQPRLSRARRLFGLAGLGVAWFVGLAASGCGDDTIRLRWRVTFEDEGLRTRAARVQARLTTGLCDSPDGELLYEQTADVEQPEWTPLDQLLPPGSYAFHARASDGDCAWYAAGCEALGLPTSGDVVVTLRAVREIGCAGTCREGECEPGACPMTPDGRTVALYPLEEAPDGVVADLAGMHDGTVGGDGLGFGTGPEGCGSALEVRAETDPPSHVRIEDSPAWDLEEGAVDLWLRVPEPGFGTIVPLSRDARAEVSPGHLTIATTNEGRLVVRVQPAGAACSDDPLVPGRWTHVGVNLGSPELALYLDGARQTSTDHIDTGFGDIDCNTGPGRGIAGNDNPWILGASTDFAEEGTGSPLGRPFTGGGIDHVRISSVRRDFGALAR